MTCLHLLHPFVITGLRALLCQAPSQRGLVGTEGSTPPSGARTWIWSLLASWAPGPATWLPSGGLMITPTRHPELTYDLHGGQVYPDLLEAGEAGRRVVLPTLAVVAPAPVVGAFGRVVQPAGQRESSGERGGRPGACRAGLPEPSSPTCARTPRRSSPRPRAPGSGTPWGGRTASLHRRSERQTETPRGAAQERGAGGWRSLRMR